MSKLYRVYIEIEADDYQNLAEIYYTIVQNIATYPPQKVLQHQRVIIEEQK
jgi:hypothetical protein